MKASDHTIKERTNTDLITCRDFSEYDIARSLIEEYIDSLPVSLEFEDMHTELDRLEHYYGPPTGVIIMVKAENEFVGCVCIRNLGDFIAEIKRMYVRPEHRGKGLGRQLVNKAIEEAKGLGYRFIRLDTIPDMRSAIHLFASSGFYEIEGLAYNPHVGARYMEYKL